MALMGRPAAMDLAAVRTVSYTHLESGTGDCSYTDVPSSQWYAQPVRALCALGLFDNGTTFRPEAVITRAEFVDLLVRLKPQAEGTAV